MSQETMSQVELSQLPVGCRGEILSVDGQPGCVSRLNEMGFQSGRTVEMVRRGSTFIVRLDHCKMCLRPCDTCITVRPLQQLETK